MAQYNSVKRVLDFEDSEDDDLLESEFASPFYSEGLNYGNIISRGMSINEKYVIPRNAATINATKARQNAKAFKSSKLLIALPLICAAALVSIYLLKDTFNPLKILKVKNKTWNQLESINKELLNWYKEYSEAYKGEFSEAEFSDKLDEENKMIQNLVSDTCQSTSKELENEELSKFRSEIYDNIVKPHITKVNWAAYQACYSALHHLASIGVKHDPSLYGAFEGFNTLSFFGKSPFKIKHIYANKDRENFVDVKDVKQRIGKLVNILQRADTLLNKPYNAFIQYTELYTVEDQSEIEERIRQLKKDL